MTFFLMIFLPFFALCSLPHALCDFSPNHPVRSYQHIRRNSQTNLLGGLEIDYELKLRRPLNG
jgi:hypothetical protein